jgi:hypothetical protein
MEAKMIQYEDFALKIEPKRGDVYPVIVLSSPAGEGRSSFSLPYDLDEIGDVLFDLGQTVRSSGRAPLPDVAPAATRTPPQQIGDQLFNALFSGSVRSLLDQSLGMIRERERGLRIKLHIDPEDPSLAYLASLPWELMYRKETRDFLNLSRFTPIVRYLDVQRPYVPLLLQPPLRILVVISSPVGYPQLDLDRERAQIEAGWGVQEGVEVEFQEPATLMNLHDRLVERPYHALHFMGHGDFDERSGQGVLLMEDEDREGDMVGGSALGVLLRDVPTLRLVFLNACETARITKETGLDPFAGVAAAMVLAGIPAVVAMQFPISDRAAITFAGRFYSLLARNYPVDTAVAESRRATYLAEAGTMEWATPVLFMRTPQGIIFQVAEGRLPADEEEAAQRRFRPAVLYAEAVQLLQAGQYREALAQWEEVQALDPQYPDPQGIQATARRQLEKPDRPVSKARLPTWAMAAIGGLVLIAIVLGGILALGGLGGETVEVSPTAPAAAVVATDTLALTSAPEAVAAADTAAIETPAAPLDVELPPFVSNALPDAEVLDYDDFDRLSLPWEFSGGYVKASDGLLEVTGVEYWETYLRRPLRLSDGTGVLLLFKYDTDAEFAMSLMSGDWGKPSYRAWTIGHSFEVTSRQGADWYDGSPLGGNLTWTPGTWYTLLLAIGQEGEMVTHVWQGDDASQESEYRQAFGADWSGLDWQLEFSANAGKLTVDSFAEIAFSDIR